MALFKIFKGQSSGLPKTYKDGYCYFTTDDGKMYIDTKDSDSTGRICLNADKADKDGNGNIITSTYLPLSGGTMTGNILFKSKGIKIEAPNVDVPIWTAYSSTEGTYGFRLQYDGTGSGNDNTLSLIADNQSGDEVRAYKILQDGVVSFTKTIDGNAATATILKNSRNLKIGNTSKSFNGSSDLTWTDNEIGFLNLVTRGTELADETDLNSVNFGNFYSEDKNKSATLINAPITGAGFRLISQRGYNSTSTAYQWQFATTSSRRIYQRYKGTGDWSAWGTFVLNPGSTALGSTTQPVYIKADGTAAVCTAYTGLLTAFSSSANTLSLTVGGTTDTAAIVNSISNTWTGGTTAGPTLKTTVNGIASTAVAIPAATASASGIVTTGSQHFAGQKYFDAAPVVYNSDATPTFYLYPKKATRAQGSVQCSYTNTDGIGTGNRMQIVQWSYNSTAATANSHYEIYNFPKVTADRTANATYEIFTSKSYSTLDSRYLRLAGGIMTGIPSLRITNLTKGTKPSSTEGTYLQFVDKAGSAATNRLGMIYNYVDTDNNSILGLYAYKAVASSSTHCYLQLQYLNENTRRVVVSDGVKIYGAVWNDYAEYRSCKEEFKPGQVVYENGDDTLSISNSRLQRGCSVVSDTYGFAIGKTDEAECPIAVSGRVLAYGYEPREEFKKHIGWPVCSGPNGTVSIMTEEEEEKYPSRIIGIISAVPDYEEWGTENIKVDNRIWIKVK